jgi:molybdopterin converting factor subunit 1
MIVTVHLFARGRELAGADHVLVELPAGATVSSLRAALVQRVPALESLLAVSAIAVNHDFAAEDQAIGEADEVAVIPPVSGG